MGVPESLLLFAVLGGAFWFGHPIWLGWGWPDVTARVREVGRNPWGRLGVLLVPVTVEIREPDGQVSVHQFRTFVGAHGALAAGAVLTLRRNPADPSELRDVRGAWTMIGTTLGIVAGLVLALLLILFDD